jgi:predicted O-methyltransferase YrrM
VPTILDDGFHLLLDEVKKKNPTNILEVGTATGMSATAMLLTSTTSRLTTIEIRENSFIEAGKNFEKFGVADRATRLLGDSLEVLKNLTEEYDFVFLDGSKSKYKRCLDLIEPHLKKSAVIVADNVLFRGYIENLVPIPRRQKTIVKYMREYLNYVFNDEKYTSKLYRLGDGVAVSYFNGLKEKEN